MEKTELNKQIGNRVRSLREYHAYTREQLCGLVGISVQFLAEIEAGRKSMTTYTLYHMAKALQVSTDFLVFGRAKAEEKDNAIGLLLDTLDEEQRQLGEELLRIFIRGIASGGT